MNANGENLNQHSDGSAESHMARYVEWVLGKPVSFRVEYHDLREMTCIDSGTNRLILMENTNWDTYRHVNNEYLRTAAEGGSLAIIDRGSIGQCRDVLHFSVTSANLIPTYLINIWDDHRGNARDHCRYSVFVPSR